MRGNRSFLVSPSVCCGRSRGIQLRMTRDCHIGGRRTSSHLPAGGMDALSISKQRNDDQDGVLTSSSASPSLKETPCRIQADRNVFHRIYSHAESACNPCLRRAASQREAGRILYQLRICHIELSRTNPLPIIQEQASKLVHRIDLPDPAEASE